MEIEPLNNDSLSKFNRLIPEFGLIISPGLLYRDVNDVSPEERLAQKQFFRNDVEYKTIYERRNLVSKGSRIDRRYCVYVSKDIDQLGSIVFTETLDNPHGYGKDDFHYHKWIYPKYRRSKYSRYISADLMHILFIAGIANRLYCYPPGKEGEDNFFLNKIDTSLPCMSAIYSHDGPDVQEYVFVRQEFKTPVGIYILLEFNGDLYRKMDKVRYMTANPKFSKEVVIAWLHEMDEAAEKVKGVFYGTNGRKEKSNC